MGAGHVDSGAVHPLEAYVAAREALEDQFAGVPVWSLSAERLADLTARLEVLRRQDDARFLQLVGEADRKSVGDPLGYANTVGWLAAATRATKPAARRQIKLAARLDAEEHGATREALGRGEVSLEQAAVILRSVEELPQDLTDPELRGLAEKDLVAFAEHHDPRELRILGRRILEVRAPEITEQALARVLEAEEAHAEATASFSMRPDGHGSMIGRFKIPLLAGRMLEKHLAAIAAPRHQNAIAAAQGTIPKPWRWGTAFTEYLETRPTDSIPRAGGVAATVVVTMTLDSLLGGLKAASLLDTGEAISAAQARRLACEAGIIPAVLGTRSQVLDLGRKTRFHTEPQRVAIAMRDRTCIVEDCDRGPRDAHFHHLDQWAHGGGTSVERGVMICAPHHTQIHNNRYGHQPRPGGKIKFYRRT